jgi:hypothetical protein
MPDASTVLQLDERLQAGRAFSGSAQILPTDAR